jgi:hypothetical protein
VCLDPYNFAENKALMSQAEQGRILPDSRELKPPSGFKRTAKRVNTHVKSVQQSSARIRVNETYLLRGNRNVGTT